MGVKGDFTLVDNGPGLLAIELLWVFDELKSKTSGFELLSNRKLRLSNN